MKKKIFVCMPSSMDLGGIEISLVGLLDAIDYEKYDVDLFLYGHRGALFPFINKNVRIFPEIKNLAYVRDSLTTKIKKGAWYAAWRRVWDGLAKLPADVSWGKIAKRKVKPIETEYDIALGFFLPFDVVLDKVKAKVKLGWIHTDYTKQTASLSYLKKAYEKIDYKIGVSEACKQSFLSVFPEYKDSTIFIENILSKQYVETSANAFDTSKEMPKEGIRLLTVGRFSYPKRIDEIPQICKKIVDAGMPVKWYLIGYGVDEPVIRQKIAENGMEEHVIILGKKENPYPYIKECDVYVQPSRYEGKSVSVREAQLFGKPTIITKYPTSSSQLEDGVDGVIVPMDIDGCAEGIIAVLKDTALQERLKNTCLQRDYTNANEIEKVYSLIKG